jgi:streptomycin 6-kinase
MSRYIAEQAIAHDLDRYDVIMAVMSPRSADYRRAARHRKACMAQVAAWNREDGSADMTDDELLAELVAA